MTKFRFALGAMLLALGACATGASLKLDAQTIETQLNSARQAGAYRCVPVELASAEAHLEFLKSELVQGNAVRAGEHRDEAKRFLVTVLERSNGCSPRDRDGDGIADGDDRCPDVPGIPELAGCPDKDGDGVQDDEDACPATPGLAALQGCPDKDGDGIADKQDKCPEKAEDFDGHEDEDGCPESEDSDGDGLLDAEDDCPQVPGPVENKGCPYGDRDRDGLLDKDDKCPDQPEDDDGFEDEDGCPEADNDKDGVLDSDDICPLEAETKNGFEDEDGCPDVKLELVEVKRDIGKIEIKQKVFFATGKARIKSKSFNLLNQVAQVLKAYPSMTIMVEGHTDSRGSNSFNLRLSQARADSVREYLIGQGIEDERLTAIGFGEEKPVATNATRSGREQNRRVEFTITGE